MAGGRQRVESANVERQGGAIPRSRKTDPTVIPDNPNWHRFKMACPFYRERWIGDGEYLEGRPVLYHVICLQNTPPATIDEQQCCLESKTVCWRLKVKPKVRTA